MADLLDPIVTEALRSWRIQLAAGIASTEALELCSAMLRGMPRACFVRASERTANGDGITAVLDALSPILSPAERAILVAGWSAGRVEQTLDSVVRQRALWYDSRRRIYSKMMMPAGTLFLASFIAPLPAFITGDGSVAGYLATALTPLVILGAFCFAALLFFRARALAPVFNADGTPIPPSSTDRWMLRIPLVAYIERERSIAEFGDLLANLLGAGVMISNALETTARAARNGVYRAECMRLSLSASKGQSFGAAMLEDPNNVWPRELCAAVRVGEQSGALDATLARLAQAARDSYTRAIERLAEWLPKIIYGVVAGFIIYNIFKLAFGYFSLLNDTMNSIGK